MRRGEWRGEAERGAATLWVVSAMVVLLAAAGAVMSVGTAIVQRHRAAAAADLAALAAAQRVVAGAGPSCSAGRRIAAADGARLTRCIISGSTVAVSVRVSLPGWLGRVGSASGRAVAGPVTLAGPVRDDTPEPRHTP